MVSLGRRRRLYYLLLVALMAVSFLAYRASVPTSPQDAYSQKEGRVKWVVDGDTILLEDGRKVRYAGIDTPERGEPFYWKATKRNISLVKGKVVRLEICKERPRDRFGRTLAWVYVDGVDVGEVLLKEGLAEVFRAPPCGTIKLKEYQQYEEQAKKKRLGIWSKKRGGRHEREDNKNR